MRAVRNESPVPAELAVLPIKTANDNDRGLYVGLRRPSSTDSGQFHGDNPHMERTPEEIIAGIVAKQTRNEGRKWPDWRTADPNKAIEHVRAA